MIVPALSSTIKKNVLIAKRQALQDKWSMLQLTTTDKDCIIGRIHDQQEQMPGGSYMFKTDCKMHTQKKRQPVQITGIKRGEGRPKMT